jgi:hypothetical protein
MISVPPHAAIYLHRQHVDFRKGIDALIGLCRTIIQKDPFQGIYFVFHNRSRKSVRILVYDGQGFWLCTKRLSSGTFNRSLFSSGNKMLRPCEFLAILWNGNPGIMKFSPDWKKFS